MELKSGFKLTEIGVIPDNWNVLAIGQAGRVMGGRQRSPHAIGRLTKYLRVANVFDGYIDTSDVLTMPFTADERDRFQLVNGDILLNEGQSLDLVGRSAIYRGDPPDCCFQNTLIRFRAGPDTDFEFAQYAFQNMLRTGVFASIALQTTSIAHLGTGRFGALKIALPPLSEQRAIAAALSEVDALMDELDRLIVKKRGLRLAAMQQLLTGCTRLPGFCGEWEVKRLGDLAEIVSGGTPRTGESSYWNGGIKWCTPTDITRSNSKYLVETERTISYLGLSSSGATLLPAGALLLCSRATIGEIKIAGTDICTNQGFKSLVCTPAVGNEFLYYKLLTMKQQMTERAFGSTFLEISKANVASLEIALPLIAEQTAIGAVLCDMDVELEALEARHDKTRALKQAMMQESLTGRTRLV